MGDLAYRSGSLAAELAEHGMLLTSEKADRRPPVRQQVQVCLAALKSVFGMDGTLAKTLRGLATQQGSRRRWRPIHHLRLLHQPDVRLSSRAHQGPVGIKTSQHSSREFKTRPSLYALETTEQPLDRVGRKLFAWFFLCWHSASPKLGV